MSNFHIMKQNCIILLLHNYNIENRYLQESLARSKNTQRRRHEGKNHRERAIELE
jgi:hypothetical protein